MTIWKFLKNRYPEILLVVEQDDLRNGLCCFLENRGNRVLACRNGEEGLTAGRSNPRIRVVISDVEMHPIGGVSMIHGLRKLGLTAPVVFLSGNPNVSDAITRISKAIFLPKPFSLRNLEDSISILSATIYSSRPAPSRKTFRTAQPI